MAKTKKKPKPKKVYTVTKTNWRGDIEEGKRIWKRKHDAAQNAKIHKGWVTEYELVKTGEFLIVGDPIEYVPKTPESELIYGQN